MVFSRLTLIFCICALNGGCSPDDNNFYFASISRALADPSFYNGENIELGGFLAADGSSLFLYLSEDHASLMDSGSAIRVEATEYARACAGQYVHIGGSYRFDGTDLPLMSDIKRIQESLNSEGLQHWCYYESE